MLLPWIGALAIGLALGLLGSGGSILTLPVLVYLLGQNEKTAVAGSLFIVGSIAAVGGLQFALKRTVDWRSVLLFGLPGMVGTYGGAWLGGLVSGTVQLVAFAAVMLMAAVMMLRPQGAANSGDPRSPMWVMIDGLAVGVLTGFVGVGGGFLIVPALVLLGRLPMHRAVGTSLVIIALKSFTGFVKYLDVLSELHLALDWPILGLVAAIGMAGSVVGRQLGGRVSQASLQSVFAVFLVVIGLWILGQTVPGLV